MVNDSGLAWISSSNPCSRASRSIREVVSERVFVSYYLFVKKTLTEQDKQVTFSRISGQTNGDRSACRTEPPGEHDEDADVALFAQAFAYFFIGFDDRGQHRRRELGEQLALVVYCCFEVVDVHVINTMPHSGVRTASATGAALWSSVDMTAMSCSSLEAA